MHVERPPLPLATHAAVAPLSTMLSQSLSLPSHASTPPLVFVHEQTETPAS
jgi:hypothetical protein